MAVAVVGLILFVAAGVLTAAVVTSNTGAIETDLWGITVSNISIGVVFVAGMLTTLVGVAGLLLLTGGLRRERRLRRERKVLRRENQRLTQQVGSSPSAEGVPTSEGIWRRRTEPIADSSGGPASGTERGTGGPVGAWPVETSSRSGDTARQPVEGVDRPMETRSTDSRRTRATSDSGN